MEKSLFKFIWKYSARQQLVILLITILSYPVGYILLELPKLITNEAIQGGAFPKEIFGFEFDQISYLVLLCFTFLGLVVVSNGIKLVLNVYKGRLGERMLRRLRFELFQRVLRFRLPHFKKVSSGEIIPMITSEVEDVGGFVGESIALPAYQGGTLAVQIGFIFMQNPLLGLAAISSYPLQAYVIPKLQRRVVLLSRERVKNVRAIADKVGESISGIAEIHSNDASAWHSTDLSDRLYANYLIRFKIYNWKYFIKFLNNFMNQLTPFFFYLIGGYLVIEGELSIGALLAVIAAYKDLAGPWKELLAYYQMVADVDVKYQTVVENFDPPDIYPVDRLTSDDAEPLAGEIVFQNVSFSGGAAGQEVFEVSLHIPDNTACAIIGPDGSGRSEVLQLAAGLLGPNSGRVEIGGKSLDKLPESVIGRQIAYVGPSVHIWTGTVRDNLFYGLRHRPLRPPERKGEAVAEHERLLGEARQTANPLHDGQAEWEDYAAAGVRDADQLDAQALDIVQKIGLASDIYRMGLQSRLDPAQNSSLAYRILTVRQILAKRVEEDKEVRGLVELWDIERFNNSATLVENLLFAAPEDPSISLDQVSSDPDVKAFLKETALDSRLQTIGLKIAETMVELFANLSSDSGLLGTYSFITQDELPEFERILRASRSENEKLGLTPADKDRLVGLAFKLIPARHRLGVLDDATKEEIVRARRSFHDRIYKNGGRFVVFDPERYVAPMTIEDNLLFGRPRVDRRDARERIDGLIRSIVEEMDLRLPITRAGFDFHVGVAGARLSSGQRRRLALARAFLKNAEITILDETAAGTSDEEKALRGVILDLLKGKTLLFGASNLIVAQEFAHSVVMDQGRVVEKAKC
ncbi:ATP-binding cassette domain-containing protein [Stappia sp. F7233]|uniref:ATP-binding cassette domain-containing protein n=1 Tax=Stappia albiluteola TaxID=2758565 RepID=A0A839AA17_9HYPH|nr:ABC transporter transmembrane domain-containing protein [Stappia albiluteola]MBA5776403.1 ATP-binding cassette domain-containing protein [Stappia albiluteola]